MGACGAAFLLLLSHGAIAAEEIAEAVDSEDPVAVARDARARFEEAQRALLEAQAELDDFDRSRGGIVPTDAREPGPEQPHSNRTEEVLEMRLGNLTEEETSLRKSVAGMQEEIDRLEAKTKPAPPMGAGLLAFLPVGGMAVFLAAKFLSVQQEKTAKNAKASKKKRESAKSK
jgi:hypothetical protein